MQNRSQLAWRCRRGVKELDILLGRFLDKAYGNASNGEKQTFEKLLELQDPELLGYLLGRKEPEDPELNSLVRRIRSIPPN